MGKRGPPATPDEIKELRGTDRKDRAHPRIVPALPGEPVMPEWLEGLGEAPDVWRGKVAKYRALGTSVVGCEDQLAQYCAFEDLSELAPTGTAGATLLRLDCAIGDKRLPGRLRAWRKLLVSTTVARVRPVCDNVVAASLKSRAVPREPPNMGGPGTTG